MATTRQINLTGTWQLVARGAGIVILTPDSDVSWVVAPTDTAPASQVGHVLTVRQNTELQMYAGERLFLRGNGKVAVTAQSGAV